MDFIEGLGIGNTAWVASYDWGPPMFWRDWTLRCGEGEMGCFVKDTLYLRWKDDQYGPINFYYVDVDADGANDGSSWEDAFKHLQDALSVASLNDEIRVAEGAYRPDEDTLHPGGTGDRTATFKLKSVVALKGGYAGCGEPDPDARDIELYETILSGDLNGDDGPDFANNGENSYHVVIGSWTNSTAVLDGFTITAGNANGTNSESQGGGMYNESGSPTVTDCKFSGNSAGWGGGGMFNGDSSPTVINCTFSGNSADYGGGIHSGWESSLTAINCILWENTAPSGAQIYNDETSSTAVS